MLVFWFVCVMIVIFEIFVNMFVVLFVDLLLMMIILLMGCVWFFMFLIVVEM